MMSVISNPTTSFQSMLPFPTTTPPPSTFHKSHLSIVSSLLFQNNSNTNSLSQFRNQRKLPFNHCTSTRRLVISCGVTQITQTQFPDTVLSSDVPVLVEFIADWCGPCRLLAPVIEWASEEYKEKLKVVKIDHDANPELIEQYKIYGMPSLIMFNKGKEVKGSRREGAITKVKLKEYLEAILESVAVA